MSHVFTCQQTHGRHPWFLDVISTGYPGNSNVGCVRVNHRVSITGDDSRKQGDIELL